MQISWLKNKGVHTFLILWLAQLVSIIGSGLSAFGVGAWIVKSTGRTTDYAIVALFAAVPGALLAPVAGVLVDRWSKRRALIFAEASGLGASSLLAGAAFTGHMQMWMIWISAAVQAVGIGFTWPAMSAISTTVVPKEHLPRTVALMGLSDAVGMFLGPMLGGLLLYHGGFNTILVADVVSFALAIGLLMVAHVPKVEAVADDAKERRSMWEDIKFGWNFVHTRPGLLGLLKFFTVSNFVWALTLALLVPFLVLMYNEKEAGSILAFEGIGLVTATVAIALLGGPKNRVKGVIGFNSMASMMIFWLCLPPHPAIYSIACFSFPLFGMIGYSCSQSIWQSKVAPELHGRVFSIRRLIASMASPLAFVVVGPLADKVFGPGLSPGGSMVSTFGSIFGTDKGAGIRLMFLCMGLITSINSIITWSNARVRSIDLELEDYKPKVEAGGELAPV